MQLYCKLLNLVLNTGIIQHRWSKGNILPVFKNKSDIYDPNSYRHHAWVKQSLLF